MRHFLILILFYLMLVALFGCASYSSTREVTTTYPDGRIVGDRAHVGGLSLWTDKGIGEASTPTMGSIKGYSANPNVESIRATAEGLGAGIVRGMKATTVPVP